MYRVTAGYLSFLNKKHAGARRQAGKAAEVVDTSLETVEQSEILRKLNEENERREGTHPAVLNAKAFDDLTDTQNEDFIYVL